jgi:hypothetical protein
LTDNYFNQEQGAGLSQARRGSNLRKQSRVVKS